MNFEYLIYDLYKKYSSSDQELECNFFIFDHLNKKSNYDIKSNIIKKILNLYKKKILK